MPKREEFSLGPCPLSMGQSGRGHELCPWLAWLLCLAQELTRQKKDCRLAACMVLSARKGEAGAKHRAPMACMEPPREGNHICSEILPFSRLPPWHCFLSTTSTEWCSVWLSSTQHHATEEKRHCCCDSMSKSFLAFLFEDHWLVRVGQSVLKMAFQSMQFCTCLQKSLYWNAPSNLILQLTRELFQMFSKWMFFWFSLYTVNSSKI